MDAPAPDVETLKQRREVLKQQLKQASKALKGEAWAP
jgi:capsule polysaccharide export protein KpsE/RkpR